MTSRPLLLMLVTPFVLTAQQTERVTLEGSEVAVYNLVGRMHVTGGSGSSVTIEITRAGRDAAKLKVIKGDVHGRPAVRIDYPSDRIYYSDPHWNGRTSFSVADDGTFGDNGSSGRNARRRIDVSSRDDGLDAHADLNVIVPSGHKVYVREGVGETLVENVNGNLDVSVSSSRARVQHVHGNVDIETGSGGVELTDVTGEVNLDSGSGGAEIDGVHGTRLKLDVGSGSLRGRAIDVEELTADIGSGGVRLSQVKAPRLHMETGSGGSDIELLTPPTDVSIEGGSGGVTLRLPSSLDATLDVSTGSGRIDSDFDVKVTRMERGALRGTVGNGKNRIHIESGSGSVRLMRS